VGTENLLARRGKKKDVGAAGHEKRAQNRSVVSLGRAVPMEEGRRGLLPREKGGGGRKGEALAECTDRDPKGFPDRPHELLRSQGRRVKKKKKGKWDRDSFGAGKERKGGEKRGKLPGYGTGNPKNSSYCRGGVDQEENNSADVGSKKKKGKAPNLSTTRR